MSTFGYPDPNGPKYNTKRQYYLLAVPPDDNDYYICGICLEPVHKDEFTIDHIERIADGGVKWRLANMQPSHSQCNQYKGAIENDIFKWTDM